MNSLTLDDLYDSKFSLFFDKDILQQCHQSLEGLNGIAKFKVASQKALFYKIVLKSLEDGEPTKSTATKKRQRGEGETEDLSDINVVKKYMDKESYGKRFKNKREKRRAISTLYNVPQTKLKLQNHDDVVLEKLHLGWSEGANIDSVVEKIEMERQLQDDKEDEEDEGEEDEEDENNKRSKKKRKTVVVDSDSDESDSNDE
jgi:hypothetical protein